MRIQEYDRVLLKNGQTAYIVEDFHDGFFLADVDMDGDTSTEEISIKEIEKVI